MHVYEKSKGPRFSLDVPLGPRGPKCRAEEQDKTKRKVHLKPEIENFLTPLPYYQL